MPRSCPLRQSRRLHQWRPSRPSRPSRRSRPSHRLHQWRPSRPADQESPAVPAPRCSRCTPRSWTSPPRCRVCRCDLGQGRTGCLIRQLGTGCRGLSVSLGKRRSRRSGWSEPRFLCCRCKRRTWNRSTRSRFRRPGWIRRSADPTWSGRIARRLRLQKKARPSCSGQNTPPHRPASPALPAQHDFDSDYGFSS